MTDDATHPLKDVIGPTDQLERVLLERIEAAEEFARMGRALLARIHGGGPDARPARLSRHPQRYSGLDPYPATVILLRDQERPLLPGEIVEELLAGNVMTGSKSQRPKHKAELIKKSLKANVNNGKLKMLNGRFGFPDWRDEMFR
jgi:hypothetical protein